MLSSAGSKGNPAIALEELARPAALRGGGRSTARLAILRSQCAGVTGLGPDLAALRTGLGLERPAERDPQPGLHVEAFATLIEIAFQYRHLGAAWHGHRDRCCGSPALQAHLFVAIAVPRNELNPGRSAGGR